MQFAILTLLLTTASCTTIPSPSVSNAIEARFPSDITGISNGLVERAELLERDCKCGKEFKCTKSVAECCKSTSGFGMCNTKTHKCKCGKSCNPLQCGW